MMILLFIALSICYKSHHITKGHLRECLTLMKNQLALHRQVKLLWLLKQDAL